jgi:hypothetical protein
MGKSALLLLLWPNLFVAAQAQQNQRETSSSYPTHGTVNVVLGNEHGLVVVTDSMLSNDLGPVKPGQNCFD